MVSGFFSPFLHLCPHFCGISTPCSGPPRPRVPRVPRGPVEGRGGVPASGGYAGLLSISDTIGPCRTQPDYSRTQPDTPDTTGHNRTRPDTTGQYFRTLPDRRTRGAVQNEPDNTGHRTDKPDSIPDSIPDSSGQRTGQRTGHSPDTHRTQPDTPDNRTPTAQLVIWYIGCTVHCKIFWSTKYPNRLP